MTPTSSTATQDSQSTSSKAYTDIDSATAKVASAAHTAVDVAAENLAQAERALREAQAAVGEKVTDTAKQARSISEDALESVKVYIDLYPLRSVGIALAAGFLLSSLLRK
jgi:ElaB/YqjD/DUF883 family membrane-anchored ribosome-binding protein